MAHIGKDRTRLFDGQIIRPSEETGRELLAWLDSGAQEPARTGLHEQQWHKLQEQIAHAQNIDELYKSFAHAYRAANALQDLSALDAFTRTKDERKTVLESQETEQDIHV
jgi:hypothetical protein